MKQDTANGICIAIMMLVFIIAATIYIIHYNIIYQDTNGNPVVCDIEGTYYHIDRPECQEAVKGKWKRDSMLVWQGTCNSDGICTPKEKQ